MANNFTFPQAYAPIFHSDKTYYLISGGRASGKSTTIAAYFVMRLFGEDYFRGVVARYTLRSISSSIYRDILDLIDSWGLTNKVKITGDEIVNPVNGNMILTHALKLTEGSMSAKSKGLANCSHLLIDEATELNDEDEYVKLIDSFRMKVAERKIFLCFNPTSKSHWLYKRFFLPDGQPNPKWEIDHEFIHTTYKDVAEHLDPKKMAEWERYAKTDPEYYAHQILGHWANVGEGQVYKNWNWYWLPDAECEVSYGLDFGFSNDPTALIEVRKRGQRLWIKELIYETGLTLEDVSKRMNKLGVPRDAWITADSADPRGIETLKRLGWRNIQPSVKGSDSIRYGIDTVRSYEVYADPSSENLRLEYDNYVYRSGTDKPVDSWNHLMDALRYTVAKRMKIGVPESRYALVSSRSRGLSEWETF